jgi:type I restriction enzyme S subunit
MINILAFSELFNFQKKSHFKAGEGNKDGLYPFYTSSTELSKRINTFLFEAPSLIFGTGGQASVHYYEGRFAVSTDCFVTQIKNSKAVFLKYVYYYLNGNIRILEEGFKGAGLKHISKEFISDIKIPLPPLEIQKKIASILDKADELRQNDRKILEKYDQLAQSVFLEMFGDPVKNEKGWDKKRLEHLGKWHSGGTPDRSKKDFFKGSIPWLSSGELEQLYTYRSKECISLEALRLSASKMIEINSLLLGMYDTAALKSTINKIECTCNQAIAFSKLDEKLVNVVFIYFLIQYGKEHYRRMQRGVRQKNMNLTMIKQIEVICPPIHLQNKFVSFIDYIEIQKQLTQRSLQKSYELFQSLLQKAFRGEIS